MATAGRIPKTNAIDHTTERITTVLGIVNKLSPIKLKAIDVRSNVITPSIQMDATLENTAKNPAVLHAALLSQLNASFW